MGFSKLLATSWAYFYSWTSSIWIKGGRGFGIWVNIYTLVTLPKCAQICDFNSRFARKRVEGAYLNFKSAGHMFEKYDATDILRVGSGGEYDVQLGFGWTNGVVLDLLDKFGEKLIAPEI